MAERLIAHAGLADQATVLQGDLASVLPEIQALQLPPFDLVFIDHDKLAYVKVRGDAVADAWASPSARANCGTEPPATPPLLCDAPAPHHHVRTSVAHSRHTHSRAPFAPTHAGQLTAILPAHAHTGPEAHRVHRAA